MSIRKPAVAGQFYPADAQALKEELKQFIEKDTQKHNALGVILPHAGYIYSGAVAGAVIAKLNNFDTYVIIGPNHTGYGPAISIYDGDSWETPLGEVKVNQELVKEITAQDKNFEPDASAHRFEHSVEVEIPFFQFTNKQFEIIPVVVGTSNLKILKEAGSSLAEVLKKHENSLVAASSDMTHYESRESAKEKDQIAVDAILRLDEELLMRRIQEHDISMCGYAPVIMMLACAKKLGAKKGELIKYQTSGDASGDYSSVVGYAGVIIS